MSVKRRDNKNRVLQTGESQRKDGRYAYKYVDNYGKVQFVYAWKLVPTDRTPAGKRDDLSLREKVKQIKKDLDDGIDTKGGQMTVCELYEKQIRLNGNVKPGTKIGRQYLLGKLQDDIFGGRSIESVKMSDAKEWAVRMKENGYSFNSIKNHKRSLSAAFHMAVQDDCIRKNPFDFDINDVIENDTAIRDALTPEQQEVFLEFAKNDRTYGKNYDELIILLGTGLRISELCGLTDDYIDIEKRIINIDHQLLRNAEMGYYIDTPKTESGYRQLYMTDEVQQAFIRVLEKRKPTKFKIDGYTNFIFLKRDGEPKTVMNYESMFRNLMRKCSKAGNLELPKKITPHILRHTFCTNMANKGMNPKALQYIMGHANIMITMNYYAHASFDSVKAEMQRVIYA